MCGAREMFADRPLRGVSLNLAFSCLVPLPVPPRLVLTRLPSRACMHARCASSERTPRHLGWRSCTRQWASRPLLQRSLALLSCFGSLGLGAYHPHARSLYRGRRARILLHLRTQSECTALRSCRLAAFQRPHVAKVANELLRKVHEQTRSVNQ